MYIIVLLLLLLLLLLSLLLLLLLLLMSKPQQAALKGTISLGDLEKRKDRKSRREQKMVGFSAASLFPTRKRKAITKGGTIEPGG